MLSNGLLVEKNDGCVVLPWEGPVPEFSDSDPVVVWRVVIDCWRALPRLESLNGVQHVGLGMGVARGKSVAGGAAQ